MFYSPERNGFFESDPGDGYEISADRHVELLIGQGEGKTIASQRDGKPYLKSPSELDHAQLTQLVQLQRKNAYAADSDPLYMEWQYDQTSESEQAWRQKVEEIKERFPLPAVS